MMNKSEILHKKALSLAKEFRRVEVELVDVLQKIDTSKAFRTLGYSSLFDYTVKGLGFTESVAYMFISVARKAKEVPALQAAISNKTLSASQARRVTPILTQDNAIQFIEKAQTLTQKELEKEIAKTFPRDAKSEKARYITETRLELRLGVSETLMMKLNRIQDLESQRTREAATLENAIEAAMDLYLEKMDPLKKAERALKKETQIKPSTREAKPSKPDSRQAIPSKVKHQVSLRDQGRCTYLRPDGRRCDQTRWIEIHHRIPKDLGGTHELNNLISLCNNHHRMIHDEVKAHTSQVSLIE